jgi:hypothetical protein
MPPVLYSGNERVLQLRYSFFDPEGDAIYGNEMPAAPQQQGHNRHCFDERSDAMERGVGPKARECE